MFLVFLFLFFAYIFNLVEDVIRLKYVVYMSIQNSQIEKIIYTITI